ncbi:hypothetical protein [Asanoa iriomotensis]|nr:hypothetical protein [Asanoa iriomotensis]
MRRVTVPLVAVLVAVLAGCSASRGGGGANPSPSSAPPATTETVPATPQPTLSLSIAPPPGPTAGTRVPSPRPASPRPSGAKAPTVVNVTGTVTEGVEPGCLLVEGYLLVNAPTSLVYAGVRVRLTLEVRPDLVSTCQQGTPAMITSAQRL